MHSVSKAPRPAANTRSAICSADGPNGGSEGRRGSGGAAGSSSVAMRDGGTHRVVGGSPQRTPGPYGPESSAITRSGRLIDYDVGYTVDRDRLRRRVRPPGPLVPGAPRGGHLSLARRRVAPPSGRARRRDRAGRLRD